MRRRERELNKLAKEYGLTLGSTSKHYAFMREGIRVAVTSKTPSERRGWRNLKAHLAKLAENTGPDLDATKVCPEAH